MHEIVVQLMRYARGTWRYRWWMLGVAWAVCLVGWTVVAKLPDQFEASARVFVDTSSVLQPYLRGLAIDTNDTQRKIFLMTRTLLSQPNLEKVMRMTDLDLRVNTDADREDVIDELKRKITFDGTRRENLYTISYQDKSPELAKLVVKSLLTIFMESNLGEVRKDQDSAAQFLEAQIAEYERRLRDQEEVITRFRQRNLTLLPNESGGYYERLRQARENVDNAKLDLSVAEDRFNTLRAQVEGDEPSFGVGTPPTRAAIEIDTRDLDHRIQTLEVNLDNLLLKYTDKHPDVVSTRKTLVKLGEERTTAIAEAKKQAAADSGGAGPSDYGLNNNPMYQQMRMSAIQAEADLAAKRRLLTEYSARVKQLESEFDKVLSLETERTGLERDYAIMQKNHAELEARLESARLGRKADNSADTVRFRVIDPPSAPSRPAGPNRVLFSTAALVAGLVFGLALAFVMSQFRPTFDDRQMMSDLLGLPVLGSVNMIWTSEQIRARKTRNISFVLTLTALLLTFAVVLVLYQFDIALLPRLAQSLNLT